MGLVNVDPLSVLPVMAASASAAFARASDPARDDAERREHLTFLQVKLAAVRELLDSCEQETASLAGHLNRRTGGAPCRGALAVCRRCPGEPLDASFGVGHCPRCGWAVGLPAGGSQCAEAGTVVLRDITGEEQALCLSHAADAVRHAHHLSVVVASRRSRAVLAESSVASCVISSRLPRLGDLAGVASQ